MLTHGNLASQCAGADRDLAFHRGRHAAPRPAGLPHAWAVHRDQYADAVRRHDAVPAEIRRRRGVAASAAGDGDDGRSDLLHAAAPASGSDPARRPRICACSSRARRRSSPKPMREFRERTGHAILERYGMTETNMNTSNPYDGERIAGTVGLPLAGCRTAHRRSRQAAQPLPTGEIGMIEVRGPNVFKGYWRMPEKTAEEFRADGFFITGDLGRIDDNGYVSIVGRGKDLIITGGFNVYPKEVETEIDLHRRRRRIGRHRPAASRISARASRRSWSPPRTPRSTEARRSGPPASTAGEIQAAEARAVRRGPAAQRHGQGAEGDDAADLREALRVSVSLPEAY